MRIGVDVGGTNTDAVLLDGASVRASVKRPTSSDISSGIRSAIEDLLAAARTAPTDVEAVMIGTTHFTNAFVQASGLARVAAMRIGFPASRSIPPFSSWPKRLAERVRGDATMIAGGYQFDGRRLGELDEVALREAARRIGDAGISEIAVTAVFAQVNAQDELRAAAIIEEELPGASVTLSSEVGRIGMLERENAAIMNASLRPLASHVAEAFSAALHELGIDAPFFVSQNDGTLMSAALMQRFPVLTFAAGPTNSLRGAYFLTGVADALVVDIGGTTSDIGVLAGGFPRQSSMRVDIGGIRTNFRTPDILSIGLGGGSMVRFDDARTSVGPESVGFRLLEEGIDRMKTSPAPIPLILVGGGAALIDHALAGTSETIRPTNAGVANAVGAAIGQIGGEVDRIFNCGEDGRERALAEARQEAVAAAIDAGAAASSVEIVNMEDLPLQYLPGGARRIICRAVGDLQALGGTRG